jgi:hypothetical protein
MAFTSLVLGAPAFPAGARGLFSSGGLLRALLGTDNAGPSTEEPQARSRATCRWCSGRRAASAAGNYTYSRIHLRKLLCHPDACG